MNSLASDKISIVENHSHIRPENKKLIELLVKWVQEPDEMGEVWWDSFERDLTLSRVSLGERIEGDII